MNSGKSPEWLLTTVTAVRELMLRRLETDSLNVEAKRDMEMALEELDVMWEELQGQAALLVRENERYAEFFEHAPDAYLITDAGGSVRETNLAALELLQAARDDVVGKVLSEYIADEDRVNFLSRTIGLWVGAGIQPLTLKARVLRNEDAPIACEFTVRAIPLKKSGVGGLCWLMRPQPR